MEKVNENVWKEKMNNLIQRRSGGIVSRPSNDRVGNYKLHLAKCKVGQRVLDVGCGSQAVKEHLHPGVYYVGIDPFPCVPEAIKMKIEECNYKDRSFDTVICFAVLDGVNDFNAAMKQIARLAGKNIIILTGVEIPIDKYHTYELRESDIDNALPDFKKTVRDELGSRKVLLLEYTRL